jgi:hypothetical protein
VALAEYATTGIADPGKRGIVAELKGRIVAALVDPLALLDKRSPGKRNPGALHLTKSGVRPHERVLADVRQREPDPDLVPGAERPAIVHIAPAAVAPSGAPHGDISDTGGNGYPTPGVIGAAPGFPWFGTVFGGAPAALGTPPGNGGNPGSPNSPPGSGGGNPGSPNSPPGSGGGNPDSPNSPPGNTGNPDSPGTPPGNAGNPGNPDSPPDILGNPDSPNSPPGDFGNPDNPNSPPGNTDNPPGNEPPVVIAVPEPATWLLMILGLIVLLLMRRTGFGRTDQHGLPCADTECGTGCDHLQ